MLKKLNIFVLLVFALFGCAEKDASEPSIANRKAYFDSIYSVAADIETDFVQSISGDDAADDPAIWVHPEDASRSVIYGTNKKLGLAVYNLEGKEIYFYATGKINNVDVAYNYELNGRKVDLCCATNRSYNSIDLFVINQSTGELSGILADSVFSEVDDVYGICFYRSPVSSKYYIYVNGKNGDVEQYEISTLSEKLKLTLLRTIKIGNQVEGMVADNQLAFLYVGEEEKGIWKLGAEPADTTRLLLGFSDEQSNKNIKYDLEGITIYYSSDTEGYLIASSQGNNSYAIFDRTNNNSYIGNFKIVSGIVDGTEDTDGIDVLSQSLGSKFPNGIFIAQDGTNQSSDKNEPQNFKYVNFGKISNLFHPPLELRTNYQIRNVFK